MGRPSPVVPPPPAMGSRAVADKNGSECTENGPWHLLGCVCDPTGVPGDRKFLGRSRCLGRARSSPVNGCKPSDRPAPPLRANDSEPMPTSERIEFSVQDHGLTDPPCFPECFRRADVRARRVGDDLLDFLVEQAVDGLAGMRNSFTVFVEDRHRVRMLHSLCNHQPVDAVGGEILHVAVEQAGALAVERAIAVANDGANRRPRAIQAALAYAPWHWG